MELLKESINIISAIILLASAGVAFWWQMKSLNPNKYTWQKIEKGVVQIKNKIEQNNYIPDAIIPMGRGGAVLAGLLSYYVSNLKGRPIPIYMIDRSKINKNNKKVTKIHTDVIDFKKIPNNVLLVCGVISSGTSIDAYKNMLNNHGVKTIKIACLLASKNNVVQVDYLFKEMDIDPKKLDLPWYQGKKDWEFATQKSS